MALPAYFSRITDAVAGVVPVTPAQLDELLAGTVVAVRFGGRVDSDPAMRHGSVLLVNLLARLYPRLELVGSGPALTAAADTARRVNPDIDLGTPAAPSPDACTIGFGTAGDVTVDAVGWTALVDEDADPAPAAPFAAALAAALGAAELFRLVFADHLGARGRRTRQPGSWTLTGGQPSATILEGVTLPPMHLAGAGAIGQACALMLGACGAVGRLTVVDPEQVELSNLQRYVLSGLDDVGARKVDVVERALTRTGWQVDAVGSAWGADLRSAPGRDRVLVALDSARDRLAVAAGLHRRIYNAWTQPADLGWSRHEDFGTTPCLACLYYPDRPRPSEDELIASALAQHRLRILSYLTTGVPVGSPLPLIAAVADIPPPPAADQWLMTPLLADLVSAAVVPPEQALRWADKTVGQLYGAGICGGGLLQPAGAVDTELTVPLAHQSALAGIMLAFEAVAAAVPELAADRPRWTESRFDVLAGFPQVLGRPRQRTAGCLCSDADYLAAARAQLSDADAS